VVRQPSGCSIQRPGVDVTRRTSIVVRSSTPACSRTTRIWRDGGGQAGQIWTNWAEQGGLPGVDDDGNGSWTTPGAGLRCPGQRQQRVAFRGLAGQDNDPTTTRGTARRWPARGALTDNGIGVRHGLAGATHAAADRLGAVGSSLGLWICPMRPGGALRHAHAATSSTAPLRASMERIGRGAGRRDPGGGDGGRRGGNNFGSNYIGMREDVIAVAATDAATRSRASRSRQLVALSAPGVRISSPSSPGHLVRRQSGIPPAGLQRSSGSVARRSRPLVPVGGPA